MRKQILLQLILLFFQKEVFNLKEIEKWGAKKGVVLQTIKDVNQSLVDDNLVNTDKIGAGAFFWALPSMGYQSRQNLINNVTQNTAEVEKDISEAEVKIEQEKEVRVPMDGKREQMLKELEELKKENSELNTRIKMYEKCDPKRLDEINANKKICKDAMVRWTDNLYEMENWIKKNNQAMTNQELHQAFPILKDLDYLD
eukprot:403374287